MRHPCDVDGVWLLLTRADEEGTTRPLLGGSASDTVVGTRSGSCDRRRRPRRPHHHRPDGNSRPLFPVRRDRSRRGSHYQTSTPLASGSRLASSPLPQHLPGLRDSSGSPLPRPRPVLLDEHLACLAVTGSGAVTTLGAVARVPVLGPRVAAARRHRRGRDRVPGPETVPTRWRHSRSTSNGTSCDQAPSPGSPAAGGTCTRTTRGSGRVSNASCLTSVNGLAGLADHRTTSVAVSQSLADLTHGC